MDYGIKMAYPTLREQVYNYVKEKYGSEPEYLWRNVPCYAVFRHLDNQKWYSIVMDVKRSKLGLEGDGYVDVVNVKLKDIFLKEILLQQVGFCYGYHGGGGGHWISILLDGTVSLEEICPLIDMSFEVTASKQKRQKLRPPKEVLIPVNQAQYDILHAFDESDILEVPKHIKGIKAGDTAYIYVSAPVSAILYQCKVLDTGEPCKGQERITNSQYIKAQLLKRYSPNTFTFQILREKYGVYAIRGMRSVPNSLSHALKHQERYDYD